MTIELIQKIINAIADEVYENGPEYKPDYLEVTVGGINYPVTVSAELSWTTKECDKNDPGVPTTIDQSVSIYITSLTIHTDKADYEVEPELLGKEIVRS